jgi:DNA-binding transcriptional regulator of glucitol operon
MGGYGRVRKDWMLRCAPCAVALYARHDQAELSPEEQMEGYGRVRKDWMSRCAPYAVALYARHDQAELSPEEQMGGSQTDQKTQPRGPFIG